MPAQPGGLPAVDQRVQPGTSLTSPSSPAPTTTTGRGRCWTTRTRATTSTSYRSQISSVFQHPGKKDLYIALADYVWLPIRFDGDRPVIDWHDEWRIEDYD
ncbi:hypothetical protein [Actinoplanes sp. DH11]|uniref:hypothetical protein n=1 Tax=Actinoplanes sp. DH11 TaxID=2857011 RepID=UPI001E558550|nr:hypothetical protein [Actinoplanes sp. DH11]